MRRNPATELVTVTGLNGLAVAVRIAAAVLVNKVMAVVLGPIGLGLFAQAQNLISFSLTISTNGLAGGVTKLTAERQADRSRLMSIWGTAISLALFWSLAFSAATLLFADEIAWRLFGDRNYGRHIEIVACAIPFGCVAPVLIAVLNGQLRSVECALAPIITNVLGAAATILLCSWFGLLGSLYGIVAAQIAAVVIGMRFFLRFNSLQDIRPLFDTDSFRSLLGFAAMAIVGGAASQGAALFIRTEIVGHVGWNAAGLWQAITKISEVYLSVATSSLTIFYLPRLAAISKRDQFIHTVSQAMMIILPVTAAGCVLVFVLKDWIISLALSSEFLPIKDIIWVQLIADFLKIASFFFAMVMWAKQMVRTFLATEITFAVLFAISARYLLQRHGLIGVLYAQTGTYALYLVTCMAIALYRTSWQSAHTGEDRR